MASSIRRKAQQVTAEDPRPAASQLHDDQLDVDDMNSIGMFLLSRRESGATIDDPEDLFPVYGMDDVYGIHSGTALQSVPASKCVVMALSLQCVEALPPIGVLGR